MERVWVLSDEDYRGRHGCPVQIRGAYSTQDQARAAGNSLAHGSELDWVSYDAAETGLYLRADFPGGGMIIQPLNVDAPPLSIRTVNGQG